MLIVSQDFSTSIIFTTGLTSIIFAINYDCEVLNHVIGTYTPPEVVQLPAVEESTAVSKCEYYCVNYSCE